MLTTGVELVTGIPGAGKSFFLVERLLGWVLREQRPVFTNLPLRWRVIRRYLEIKGGAQAVALIHELTEDRLNLFLEGFGRRQGFISRALEGGTSRAAAVSQFEASEPDLSSWWIPAGSVICADEVHHWYPNPALPNVRKREPEELMSFLTMHRHGQYLCVFATQAERQISTTVKSLCSTRFRVQRWDRQPIAGTFSLEFIGLPILRYEKFQGEDDPDAIGVKPLETFTRFPSLPWYQIFFRLYESFTHSGGRHEAEHALFAARKEAGLIKEKKVLMPRQKVALGVINWLLRWSKTIGLALICFYAGHRFGTIESEDVLVSAPPEFTIVGTAPGAVMLSTGDRVQVGGMAGGYQLTAVLSQLGTSVWRQGDVFRMGRLGETLSLAVSVDQLDLMHQQAVSDDPSLGGD